MVWFRDQHSSSLPSEHEGQTLPFFDPVFNINLEHRDPQGRTAIHAISRSTIGADYPPGAAYGDNEGPYWEGKTSLFHTARQRGANLLAVDGNGKSVLHYLLEPKGTITLITDSLQWMLDHHRSLIVQPDRFGTYPLHSALQQLANYPKSREGAEDPAFRAGIDQLLKAGADPHIRDGRGNTVLHYVVKAGLTGKKAGEPIRTIPQQFIALGVDVNARNKSGWTAFSGVSHGWDRNSLRDPWPAHLSERDGSDEIDNDVLSLFDRAGADWTATYSEDQTLLHIVAIAGGHEGRARFRARYLLDKGVDRSQEDAHASTVEIWLEGLDL
jgi:hypothetical protein